MSVSLMMGTTVWITGDLLTRGRFESRLNSAMAVDLYRAGRKALLKDVATFRKSQPELINLKGRQMADGNESLTAVFWRKFRV